MFRVAVMRRHNLKEFQLSQAYLFYYDKLERANYFLEQILDTADEDLDGRLVQTLLESPVDDGGQWDMAANLVEKYGLVGCCCAMFVVGNFVDVWLHRSRTPCIPIHTMP